RQRVNSSSGRIHALLGSLPPVSLHPFKWADWALCVSASIPALTPVHAHTRTPTHPHTHTHTHTHTHPHSWPCWPALVAVVYSDAEHVWPPPPLPPYLTSHTHRHTHTHTHTERERERAQTGNRKRKT